MRRSDELCLAFVICTPESASPNVCAALRPTLFARDLTHCCRHLHAQRTYRNGGRERARHLRHLAAQRRSTGGAQMRHF
eukprot:5388938-Pleurochrysis_carterae.AAC.1